MQEGQEKCEKLGIPDVTRVKADKLVLKNMFKKACMADEKKELNDKIMKLEKLKLIKDDDTNRKKYIETMSL